MSSNQPRTGAAALVAFLTISALPRPLSPCHPLPQLADYFVRWWTRDHYGKYGPGCLESGDDPCGPMYYVTWYGVLGLALFIGLMIPRGAFLYAWAMGASNRQHAKSIHRILYAPLGFFLNTPVGDLLVSFTKDQDVMDDALPDALYYAGIYGEQGLPASQHHPAAFAAD